jgi:hypothetical protein
MRTLLFCLPALALLLLATPARAADLLGADRSIPEVVDHYIDAALAEQNIKPAALADDAALLRRLTLDLAGRIPTTAELHAYVSSTEPDKKLKLIDRLLASPAFARHQVNEFDAMLAVPPMGRRGGGSSLREYLTTAFRENRPWDRIFRDLVLADEKEPGQKGSSQFLKARVKDLDRLTTDVSVLFFGVNISCAQCHDHPLVQDWKQDHYYGLKSFFARTYEAGPFLGERDAAVVQFKTTKNITKTARLMFLTGKVVDGPGAAPLSPEEEKKLIDLMKKQARVRQKGTPSTPPPAPRFSARAALAELALQAEQRDFFARAIVNRLWHRLFGLGLVSPIDQMHSENAPSHPDLLAWLARDTAENKYDLKRLIRGLVLSKVYARSSRYDSDRFPPPRSFAVARLRALTPMQLATSLRLAAADPEQFPATLRAEELDRRLEQIENSARGLAGLFEQPRDDFQIGVAEALLFSNSDRLQRELLTDGRNTLIGKMKEAKSPEQAIDLAVRSVLSRTATAEEKHDLLDYVAKRRERIAEAYRQVVWALLSSAEFRFNY